MQAIDATITVFILEDSCRSNDKVTFLIDLVGNYNFKKIGLQNVAYNFDYWQSHAPDIIVINSDQKSIKKLNILSKIYTAFPKIPIIFILDNEHQKNLIKGESSALNTQQLGIQDYLIRSNLSTTFLDKSIEYILKADKVSQKVQHLEKINLHLESQLEDNKKLFKTIVDCNSDLIWTMDAAEKYTFLNQSWLSYTGQSLAEGLNENWRDRIHPEDLVKCEQTYNSALKKYQGFQIEYRLRRFDNSYRVILNTAMRQHNEEGEFAGLLCSCSDITQRKKIEQKIIKQAQIDCILADIIQDIHSSLDINIILQTATEKVNQYLLADRIFITKIVQENQLTLLFESKVISCSARCDLTQAKQLPNQEFIDNLEKLSQGEIIASNNALSTTIVNINSPDLPSEPSNLLLVPIIVNQKLWGSICVEQNLSPRNWKTDETKLLKQVAIQLGVAIKQSEMYQELERLAVIDSLTKVANRRKLDSYLAAEWKRLAREKNYLSLILCDVDYFKLYNDTYGHQAGDICLQKVAQAISKTLKRPADLVARYGGEEFAVILPNTDIRGATSLAEQIRLQIQSLKIPHINSSIDLYITLSFGVSSSIPSNGLSFQALVAAADKGLYRAKELGRNRVVKFDLNQV